MKNLLNEIKAMNKIAGTQLTKQQEIALIRERLAQLNELEFGTQKAFDAYQKKHDMRGDTQVTVAGKKMSVSQAVKQSGDKALKGSSVFGKGKGADVFGSKEKYTNFSKKYAEGPAGLFGRAADADGKDFGNIDSEATFHYYKMKSGKNDLFMSRKQSKQVAKALRNGIDANIDSDANDNDDKFPPVKVKKDKDDSMKISTGGKEIRVSKKQAKELAKDIKNSFF